MKRRQLLFISVLTYIPLSGCVDDSETDNNDESDENEDAESARIIINNHLDSEVTLTTDIEDHTPIIETIPTDEIVSLDSGITETETHTVNIQSSANHETEYQWHVSDWDIAGSGGLSIEIYERELAVAVLE